MINLLPDQLKQSYRYGHRNLVLRRWIIICALALVGLGLIVTYGVISLQQASADYNRQIAASEQVFQQEAFDGTQKEVQDISNSFKLVVKVLNQEIQFSQLLRQIGAAIPDNARLTGLNISQTQGAIDITAVAKDYTTASQVQVNLADPNNKIFSKADIISINCSSANAKNADYPCTVNIKALFAKDSPFLLKNSKATP